MMEGLAQRVAGRYVFHPQINLGGFLFHSSWPQAIDQHAVAIFGISLFVDTLVRIIFCSLQELQNLVMNPSVGADQLPGVNGSFTFGVRGAPASFFDDDSERGKIPRF